MKRRVPSKSVAEWQPRPGDHRTRGVERRAAIKRAIKENGIDPQTQQRLAAYRVG